MINILKLRTDKKSEEVCEEKNYKFRPNVDSYIINTIKLNKILNKQTRFEDVEFFRKKKKLPKKLKIEMPKIYSNQDAQIHLKQFISIMSIHTGFSRILLFFKFFSNFNI